MSRKINLNYTQTDEISERVRKVREDVFAAKPQVDVRKLKIETETYRDLSVTHGPNMLKGVVFDRLSREKKVWFDDNPIVGQLTDFKYGGYFIPYKDFRWVKPKGQILKQYGFQRGVADATDEDIAVIDEAHKWWDGKSNFDRGREIVKQKYGQDIQEMTDVGVGLNFCDDAGSTIMVDYPTLVSKGLNAVLEDIKRYRDELPLWVRGNLKKFDFYNGAELSVKAMIHQAERYAELAKEEAAKCNDPVKKKELEEIAEICAWVPANPARTFREGIQAVWFIQMAGNQNLPVVVNHAPGRFPQYMYHLYRKDKDEGRLTDEQAIELMQFWFLKINTLTYILSPIAAAWNSSRLAQQLTIGGIDPETGEDATNELDYLLIEAQRRIRVPEPLLACVYHNKLSNQFLMKCAELVRTGIGQPSFHSQEVAMKRRWFCENGPIEDLRNQAIAGCVQSLIPGYTDGHWEARFNMAKPLEFALFNGKDLKTGKQYGPQTGEATEFKTYEEFYDAVHKQYAYWVDLCRDISLIDWMTVEDYPNPLTSALTYDCVEKGLDMVQGGARYAFGDGLCIAAGVDTTNSLAAIKKLVYEDKAFTMETLLKAIKANWEGYEDIQKMCLDAPKYGNDDEYADEIGRKLHADFAKLHYNKPDYLGRMAIQPSAYSVTTHAPFGSRTCATPDGRKGYTTFTDASLSAAPGTDKSGPTALVRSAVKLIDPVVWGSTHMNVKFHPSALEGVAGANKFLQVVKTYMDLGGYQIQFNCVDKETLMAAKEKPDQYKDLIVRVAGFSAFFINLVPQVQDEIIARTEQKFA